jgi:hypothetical protein
VVGVEDRDDVHDPADSAENDKPEPNEDSGDTKTHEISPVSE